MMFCCDLKYLMNGRALALQYGVSIRLMSKLAPMFQVLMTAASCQRVSGSKDVTATMGNHLFFEAKITNVNLFTDSIDKEQLNCIEYRRPSSAQLK